MKEYKKTWRKIRKDLKARLYKRPYPYVSFSPNLWEDWVSKRRFSSPVVLSHGDTLTITGNLVVNKAMGHTKIHRDKSLKGYEYKFAFRKSNSWDNVLTYPGDEKTLRRIKSVTLVAPTPPEPKLPWYTRAMRGVVYALDNLRFKVSNFIYPHNY